MLLLGGAFQLLLIYLKKDILLWIITARKFLEK